MNHQKTLSAWHKDWFRFVLFAVCATPITVTVATYAGATFSQDIWTAHALFGVLFFLCCGILCLLEAPILREYIWYAALFLLAAYGLWYAGNEADLKELAHFVSAILSTIATYLAWQWVRE